MKNLYFSICFKILCDIHDDDADAHDKLNDVGGVKTIILILSPGYYQESSLYGKTQVRENTYSGIFYTVLLFSTKVSNRKIIENLIHGVK